MSESNLITTKLDQYGEDLRTRPSIADAVMREIESSESPSAIVNQPNYRPPPKQRDHSWRWFAALATAACVMAVCGSWLVRPTTLYAQTLAALQQVKSIHVTGSLSHLSRKWPLEQPPANPEEANHTVDAWYWNSDGRPRSYESLGPVILTRDGGNLREYQSDVDLLFVSDGKAKDNVDRFSSMSRYLEALKEEGTESEELGERTEGNQTLRGLRFYRNNQIEEYWFDEATNLPVRYVAKQTEDNSVHVDLKFSYDQEIPKQALAFVPPKTERVRYAGNHEDVVVQWNRHLQMLEAKSQATSKSIRIYPREDQKTFSYQFARKTPNGQQFVVPLDQDQYAPLSVRSFVKLRASAPGEFSPEKWCVSSELLDIEFSRSDLVMPAGTPRRDWCQFALNSIGLEMVDQKQTRTFWIASHDGQTRRPWKEVKPPVPHLVIGGEVKRGVVKPGVGHRLRPATMQLLIRDFNRLQNFKFTCDTPIMIDQTGLQKPPKMDREKYDSVQAFKQAVDFDQYYVATDSPWFAGKESTAMARKWFEEQLGVTFTQQSREDTVHLIRRKQ